MVLLTATTAFGQTITNGGFESGPLNGIPLGWTAGGTQRVEVLQLSNFVASLGTNNITIPEGAYVVALSTGPGDTGGATTEIDGNSTSEDDVATLSQQLDAGAGGTIVSFEWAFLTSEANEDLAFDDVFVVSVDGSPALTGSVNKPGGVSPFPDTPAWDPQSGQSYDGTAYAIASSGPTNGSTFVRTANDGFSGWHRFGVVIPPGVHTLQFLIADQGDNQFDSALLIDNVRTVGGQSLFQVTDTQGSQVETKNGGIVWRPHQSGSVSVADNGGVVAYLSTADIANNPNAQQQVVVHFGGVPERLTTMVDGVADRPTLSAAGTVVAYAATDDPIAANPDLNQELFLHNRGTGTTSQITVTSGCAIRNPSLGGVGADRIAFQSACAGLPGALNLDGNAEIVVWTSGSGFRSIADTPATCSSRNPELSADGRYVAFLSSCDLTGGNADGGFDVFRWDLTTDGLEQVTDTDSADAVLVDGASISGDGSRIVFVSNGDLGAGGGPLSTYEVFLWSAQGPSTTRLTTSTTELNLVARIDNSGDNVVVEQLDFIDNVSKIVLLGVANPSNPGVTPVAIGPSVSLPDVGLDAAAEEAVVVFQSLDDLVEDSNPDANWELFSSRLTVQSGPQTFCSSPNVAIPDNNNSGVTDSLVVPAIGVVADVNVYLRITHTYVGDLQVRIQNGSVGDRLIVDRPQPSGGGNGSCSGNNIDAFIDDEGARSVDTECTAGTPTILSPPNFIPHSQSLDAFDGSSASGVWQLNVRDRARFDTGTLVQWCVVITVN